jgi:asparagine synthase (glutamine-hydrolysing)
VADDTGDEGIAPTTVAPESALQAQAVTAPMLLRRGLWPAHPMTDPAVVTFCEWLPIEWRVHKRVLRQRLAGLGLAQEVAHPRHPENFTPVAIMAMCRYGPVALRRMLRDGSPLLDERIVDPDALNEVATRLAEGGHTAQDREAIFVVVLDAALRAFG